MQELKPIEEKWNKKRLFLAGLTLLIIFSGLLGVKFFVLDKIQKPGNQLVKSTSVKGANIVNPINTSNIKNTIQDQVNSLQQEASGINIAEIASSSPQVQKVLNDLKTLQTLPKNEVKDFCQKVCSGL
jgi:predicted PurR-regulated permease PerM